MSNSIIKIGVVGLSNAGKTSIIRTLQRSYQIGEELVPTKHIERTSFKLFGEEGAIWDYGGQEKYRDNYLKHPEKYFSDIRYLFYVIDIQNAHSYPAAIQYFSRVYNQAKIYSDNLSVAIVFHKVDPEIQNNEETKKTIDNLSKEIRKVAPDAELEFVQTTIYNPLSILSVFSRLILGGTDAYNYISTQFANFALMYSIEYMSLIINDLFEMGSFRIKNEKEDFVKASIKFYQQFFLGKETEEEEIREYELEDYVFVIVRKKMGEYKALLSFAYKKTESERIPKEKEITEIFKEIEHAFEKYKPSLY